MKKYFFSLFFISILLSSCAFNKLNIGQPENLEVEELSMQAVRLKVYIPIENPNNISFNVKNLNLDLILNGKNVGKVKNLAKVTINGVELGIIWCAPWQVSIPKGLLKKKNNLLEIEVANTWANRMIGDEQEPDDAEFINPGTPHDRLGGYEKHTMGYGLKDLPDWLIYDQPRPSQGRYTFTSWKFYNKESPLQESGLIGPVSLIRVFY